MLRFLFHSAFPFYLPSGTGQISNRERIIPSPFHFAPAKIIGHKPIDGNLTTSKYNRQPTRRPFGHFQVLRQPGKFRHAATSESPISAIGNRFKAPCQCFRSVKIIRFQGIFVFQRKYIGKKTLFNHPTNQSMAPGCMISAVEPYNLPCKTIQHPSPNNKSRPFACFLRFNLRAIFPTCLANLF